MAPISSLSSIRSTMNHGERGHFADGLRTLDLPISRRGLFLQDSFFENAYEQLNSTVRRILERWGETDFLSERRDDPKLRLSDTLNRYRQLRTHNLKEEDQAVTVTCDNTSHKIVMDVHDFVSGEVKVKVAGEREVVVEGRTETKTGDWSVSSNSFRRRFLLPAHTDMAAVSSVLSADGILTITAPRVQTQQLKNGGSTIPIKIEGQQDSKQMESSISSSQATLSSSTTAASPNIQQSSESSTQTDAKVSGSIGTLGKQETVASSEARETPSLAHTTREQQSVSAPGRSLLPERVNLPITTRGLFFDDSFFKNTWQDFQEAVRDVVSKWGEFSSPADDLTRYRSLRARDVREETQAVKSTEDETNYKIVVDVQDFMKGGKINVRAVKDRELVVEGQVEQVDGGARFKKQFHRRFVLPRDIYPESVSSVMSADGVLTITAPKKPSTLQLKEFIVPVAIEEGVHKTESLNQVSQQAVKSEVEDRSSEARSTSSQVSSLSSASTATTQRESLSQDTSSDASRQVSCSREHIIPVELEDQQHHSCSQHQKNTYSMDKSAPNTGSLTALGTNHVCEASTNKTTSQSHASSETESSLSRHKTEAHIQKNIALNSASLQAGAETATQSVAQRSDESRDITSCPHQVKTVPISRKGAFFSDSFFEDTRRQFTSAVKDVLHKSDARSSITDDIACCRSLLKRNPKLENQAAHVEEDEHSLKIVLDVNDFIGGELKVEVVDGRELLVEGQASCEEGISASSLSFRRLFSLPRQADVTAITSALSSDGVLTIISPKLKQAAETASSSKEMATESHMRRENHGSGTQGWEESKVREEAKESEGCSSKSYSSSYSSHQQYSSQNVF